MDPERKKIGTVPRPSLSTNSTSQSLMSSRKEFRSTVLSNNEAYAEHPTPSSSTSSHRPTSATSGANKANKATHAQYPRRSQYSNFSTMSETSLPWTTKDIGFNAISGVLNDPMQRSSSTSKPTKNDIPPVPHATIKKVKPSEFDNYFKHIAPVFERYRHNKMLGTEGIPRLNSGRPSSTEIFPSILDSSFAGILKTEENPSLYRQQSSRNPYANPSSTLSTTSLSGKPDISTTQEKDTPMLDNVPRIFFDPDFNLENPRTFDAVCEGTDIIGKSGPNPPIATNTILQEKLSHYLDVVEQNLILEISRRSASFFEALSNLYVLHQETLDCVAQIHSIRKRMSKINEDQCKIGLEVVRLKRRRGNIGLLYNGVRMVQEIQSSYSMVQVLLKQEDYFSALDMITEAKHVLDGGAPIEWRLTENPTEQDGRKSTELILRTPLLSASSSRRSTPDPEALRQTPAINLHAVHALLNFSTGLSDMYQSIGKMMETDFTSTFMNDINRSISEMVIDDSITRLYASKAHRTQNYKPTTKIVHISPSIQKIESAIKDRLMPLVMGLLRTEKLGIALQNYREKLLEEVKEIIRIQYPAGLANGAGDLEESVDIDADTTDKSKDQSPILVKKLKSMTFDAFSKMLVTIYVILLKVMERCEIYHQLLLSIFLDIDKKDLSKMGNEETHTFGDEHIQSNGEDNPSSFSPQDAQSIFNVYSENGVSAPILNSAQLSQYFHDSAEILYAVADLAHIRCSKLVNVRGDQNAKLNPKDFYRLFAVTFAFIVEGEMLCGRACFGLRGTIVSQAKLFLKNFHLEKTKQEALLIENEQWAPADVPVDFQHIVDRIVEISSAPSMNGLEFYEETQQHSLSTTPSQSPRTSIDSLKPNASGHYLTVAGESFFVVGCSLLLVKMLEEYLRCIANIPELTTDGMSKLVELLKLFNDRVCQVILGAGAMESAGLKSISAKHLALASQSLGFMVALIPYLKECIRKSMSSKHGVMLQEFDRITLDYSNHQSDIHVKLVSIMNERLAIHCKAFESTDWDIIEPTSKNISPYMETLVKENITLHKLLSKYMPSKHVKIIMEQVFTSFLRRLSEEMSNVKVKTEEGKARLLSDAKYFTAKISSLENSESVRNHLIEIVEGLKLEEFESSVE